jgi:hypothetical protein
VIRRHRGLSPTHPQSGLDRHADPPHIVAMTAAYLERDIAW